MIGSMKAIINKAKPVAGQAYIIYVKYLKMNYCYKHGIPFDTFELAIKVLATHKKPIAKDIVAYLKNVKTDITSFKALFNGALEI